MADEGASSQATGGGMEGEQASLHGGAFFTALGDEFDRLGERDRILNADVLDAWFPPAPGVVRTLNEHLEWLLRTSPPTGSEGMQRRLAHARGVEPGCILPGAGSSNLLFLAFQRWFTPASRALILDPTYGEYPHLLETVIGCRVDRLPLRREDEYALDPARLAEALGGGYDLVALVNPNSPTGRHVARPELQALLTQAPPETRIWIDETYVEYAGANQSLEAFAAASRNVVVCKSMSKVYALSGARAAYLCGPPPLLDSLRPFLPPWSVSLLAQVAAVRALEDPEYYAARYAETRELREGFASGLRTLGLEPLPSSTNFLLCRLPESAPVAAELARRCRVKGLFFRSGGSISPRLDDRMIRLAVKSAQENARMLHLLKQALSGDTT